MANRILVVDDDPVIVKLVSLVLEQAGYEVVTAPSGLDALKRINEIQPAFVVSDVSMPEIDGYEFTRRLRQTNFGHVPILILTGHDTVQERIKGFEAGADEYMTKPFEPDEFLARVCVLMRRGGAPQPETQKIKGKTLAVFSLRGGVGISTIAANLSVALSQIWGYSAGLIDLALTNGTSALLLNLPLRKTWGDLAQKASENIDADLVSQVLLPHSSGAFVLAAPNRPEQGELLSGDKVTRVLSILKEQYPYLVLDLPHDFRDTTLAGLDNADEILLVLAPELAAVHSAASALEVFGTLQYPHQAIRLVLNWTFERRGLARKEIEDALQRPVDVVVPFAAEATVAAINKGVPVVLEAPTSPMGALFEDLAFHLSRPEHRQTPPASPTPAWQRASSRLQQRQPKRV